ncbi:MAG: UDP-N-acetylmuramate--L-alanine ligase [Elusimicrobiota bacterium]
MFDKIEKIHFVGIGGSGMCGIAEVLINLGYNVSGSDIVENSNVIRLKKLGADVNIGHSEDNLNSPHVVVASSAIDDNNIEVITAKEKRIPVIPRAEMLAELMRLKYALCVAGTHGKTTTTSMIGLMLSQAKKDPTVVVGGRLKNIDSNVKLGNGDFIVAEADESDGSFMYYSPSISVVTNIDNDHLEHYGTKENLKNTFVKFLNKVPFYGFSVLCGDDDDLLDITERLRRPYVTYGLNKNNDYRAVDIKLDSGYSGYTVVKDNQKLGTIEVKNTGMHNVINSLGACVTGLEMGIDFKIIKEGLELYRGVGRRLELVSEKGDIVFYDDYAHHPTEIKLSLKSLREIYPDRRIVVMFQPHRYTRTRDLYREFPESFTKADKVFITPIYPAGESSIPGVSSKLIVKEFEDKQKVNLCSSLENLRQIVRKELTAGDVCLTLGAGDICKLNDNLQKIMGQK